MSKFYHIPLDLLSYVSHHWFAGCVKRSIVILNIITVVIINSALLNKQLIVYKPLLFTK